MNKAASDMAKLRWAKATPEQRAAHVAMMAKARRKQAKAARRKKALDLAQD